MYGPPPPRPKKTNIVRSRSGCIDCRQRRRKCDEKRPSCKHCLDGGRTCNYDTYPAGVQFCDVSDWAARKVFKDKAKASRRLAVSRNLQPVGELASSDQDGDHNNAGALSTQLPIPQQTGPLPDLRNDIAQVTWLPALDSTIDAEMYGRVGIDYDPWAADCFNISLESPLQGLGSPLNSYPSLDTDHSSDRRSEHSSHERTQPLAASTLCPLPEANEASAVGSVADKAQASYGNEGIGLEDFEQRCDQQTAFGLTTPKPCSQDNWLKAAAVANPTLLLEPDQRNVTRSDSLPRNRAGELKENTNRRQITPQSGLLSTRRTSPSISRPISQPSLTIRGPDRVFLAHFVTHVSESILECSGILKALSMRYELVRSAAMALSAATLANREGTYTQSASDSSETRGWTPNQSYLITASSFAAGPSRFNLESMRSLPLDVAIAVQLLLTHFEIELGSLDSVCIRFNTIEKLLAIHSGTGSEDADIEKLWSATVNARAIARSTIGPHVPLECEVDDLQPLRRLDSKFRGNFGLVSLIASHSTQIGDRIILYQSMRAGNESSDRLMQKISDWYDVMRGRSCLLTPSIEGNEHRSESQLFQELDAYQQQLLALDPPPRFCKSMEGIASIPSGQGWGDMIDSPVFFDSYETAMEVALYAYAHIVCDSSLLRDLVGAEPPYVSGQDSGTTDNIQPWAYLLMRIAAGMDPSEEAQLDSHRFTITYMLWIIGMRCGDSRILAFLDGLLCRLQDTQPVRKDTSLILRIARRSLRIVQDEYKNGRAVYSAFTTFAPTATRQDWLNSYEDELLTLHGRDTTRRWFNDARSFAGVSAVS